MLKTWKTDTDLSEKGGKATVGSPVCGHHNSHVTASMNTSLRHVVSSFGRPVSSINARTSLIHHKYHKGNALCIQPQGSQDV